MTLDPVTAYSIAALLSSVACAMMIWIWQGAQWPDGVRFWAMGCAAGVGSFLATVLRSAWPHPLIDVVGSNCAVLAWTLFWAGMRQLRGADRPARVTLLALLWPPAGAVVLSQASMATAILVFTATMAVLGLCTAFEAVLAWRRGRAPSSVLLLALLALGYAGTQGARGLRAFGGDPTVLPQGLHLLLIVCLPIAFVFVAIAFLVSHAKGQEVAAIQSAQDRMDRLLAALPAVIFHADIDAAGRACFRYCGGDAEAVTGWPMPPPHGLARWQPLLGDEPGRLETFCTDVLKQGRAELDWQVSQPDGSWRWVRCHGRVVSRRPDGGGEVVGSILDQSVERLADARAIAAARLASVGELAAGLAHEIKQPLQAVSLLAENTQMALQAGTGALDRSVLHGSLDDILQQAARANSVVEHLRAFARTEPGQRREDDVDLPRAVDSALMLTGGTLQRAGATVCVDAAAELPLVRGDLMRLEQVLVLLLTNACDALARRAPGQSRRITISARQDAAAGAVRLLLEDTGGGIAPAVLERLFTPFVTTKGSDGAGVGLYVCRRMLAGMGGTIVARNGPQGAIFDLTLPPAKGQDRVPATATEDAA